MVKEIAKQSCKGLYEAPGCSRWAAGLDGNVSDVKYYVFECSGSCSQLRMQLCSV